MNVNNNESVINYQVATINNIECVEMISSWIESNRSVKYLVCANPHSLVTADCDPTFKNAIASADIVIPDGYGILIASKMLGGRIRERVTGNDIFLGLSKSLNEKKNISYYFLGSTDETLNKIKERLAADYPAIRFAGAYSPPFKHTYSKDDLDCMIKAVNSARPDVLWVGMTAPKQEKWIYQNKENLNVKFIGAIGAVFDFYTGNVKRSHPFFQKVGLEWLPRLLQEPRRLWRRNFISNPKFILKVIQYRLQNGKINQEREK